MRTYIPKTEAAAIIGCSRQSVEKLVKMAKLAADERGRPQFAEVKRLASIRANRSYEPGLDPADPVVACAVGDPKLGGHMDLREDPTYVAGWAGPSRADLPEGQLLTGYWEISPEKVKAVTPGGVLLAVTGGLALEAWRVVDFAGRIPFRNRAVFVVSRLPEEEEARYLGFVPKKNSTTQAVH